MNNNKQIGLAVHMYTSDNKDSLPYPNWDPPWYPGWLYNAVGSLAYALNSGSLMLSWPLNYAGWQLQTQTNSPGTGLGPNWFDVPGVISNTLNLPLSAGNGSTFFRLHASNQ